MTSETGAPPTDLRVERERAPANVPPGEEPRFSWRREGAGEQSAYRVVVARSSERLSEGDVWDSGRVESAESVDVRHGGAPLAPDETYHWRVRVWDGEGEPSPWSEPATFGTALGDDADWAGDWVGHQPGPGDSAGLRTEWRAPEEEPWVQVDLGGLVEFSAVECYPASAIDGPTTPDGVTVSAAGMDGFGFPDAVRVEVANDPGFEDARTVATTALSTPESGESATVDVGPTAARYVRVTATDPFVFDARSPRTEAVRLDRELDAWATFALAGLAVRDDDGADLARDAAVTASSSVERGPWDAASLVDGVRESRFAASSPQFRTDVELGGTVAQARVHVSTLGYGELYVNGKRVGDEVLNPGWTDYRERALYSTYDVTDQLSEGANALGIWLGRGWLPKVAHHIWAPVASPRARLHLTVEYEDGRTRTVGTDGTWRAQSSPVTENDIYDGERYDARLEQDGWSDPGFEDAEWDSAARVPGPGGDMAPQRTEPMRVVETREPVALDEREDGVVVDFGQNATGWLSLTVRDPDAGDEVELAHAEALDDDGDLLTVDLREAEATDTYVARGDDVETYTPRFTYHGFRYAKVTGYPGDLDAEDVEFQVAHTDFESAGEFDCSNDELAQVQENARWSLRTNAHSVPTDCPQRNERLGWTGDGQLAARSLLYNFDGVRFHEKWMRDHGDAQSRRGYLPQTVPSVNNHVPSDTTWPVTEVVIPWYLYCHYGDERVLEERYEEMRRYVDYWHGVAESGLIPEGYSLYGDWLAMEETDGSVGKPPGLFTDAFHYRATDVMGRIADALGFEADARRYRERAGDIREAFNDQYLDAAAGQYGPGTQASAAVPLAMGIVPDAHVDAVVETLVETVRDDGSRLKTGFLGTRALLAALTDHGHADLAYEVASQPEQPGWVYMVRQGATTTWERWDSDERTGSGMNSLNHSPYTMVSEWFYRALAGIRLDAAFGSDRRVELRPAFVDGLDWAEGSVETPCGTVASRWEREDEGVRLSVAVPWNATGSVSLPGDASVSPAEGGDLESAAGVADVDRGDRVTIAVESGTHEFLVE